MRLKRVFRWSPRERTYRVARLIWERGVVGDGQGYGVNLSLALHPTMLRFRRELDGWIVTVLGVRVHYLRSYGGRPD